MAQKSDEEQLRRIPSINMYPHEHIYNTHHSLRDLRKFRFGGSVPGGGQELRIGGGYLRVQLSGDTAYTKVNADLIADFLRLHGTKNDIRGVPVLHYSIGGRTGTFREGRQAHHNEDGHGLDELFYEGPGGSVHKLGLINDENNPFFSHCLEKGEKQGHACRLWGLVHRWGMCSH